MSEKRVVYSIQRTYILKTILTRGKIAYTCDERIDIPTIEPLTTAEPVGYPGKLPVVVPCIEIRADFLSEINCTFETNEGITVLPVEIPAGTKDPIENPYIRRRYVLVLPRGTTGVKSCKLTLKYTGEEIQHNLTFGTMPPPYNYDNALFGYLIDNSIKNANNIADLTMFLQYGRIKRKTLRTVELPKGAVEQSMDVSSGESFFHVKFDYPLSSEPTIHKPKIVVTSGTGNDFTYNLSLNKTNNIVSINLLSGMITAYDSFNGEIIQQFMLDYRDNAIRKLVFSNFDDIDNPTLTVIVEECALGV